MSLLSDLRTPAVLALSLLLSACGGNDPAPDPVVGGGGAIDVVVATDRATYDEGDEVTLTLSARNVTDESVTLDFTSSQRYDFQVEDDDGDTVWTWSASRSFLQVLGEETFAPGQQTTWTATVEEELDPGEYTAVGMVTDRSGSLVNRRSFTVR